MTLKNELEAMLPAEVVRLVFGAGSLFTIEHTPEAQLATTWVYLCDWRLTQDARSIASSDDLMDARTVKRIEGALVGASLTGISITNKNTDLEFSNGSTIHLAANTDDYDPSDDVIIFFQRGGGTISSCPARGLYRG